ncbi:putative flavonoid 3',5'-methyltransferase [Rosa chinensis]|uniref:Putative flavonoid 3',5'-methyltransferase n=1 Tax=Rosa chinensis TaxID=74649 RepID=A0A2P6R0F1_ROSCH|nr:putative flavonoid 3',5'-methyltransferase [Rosa chinensis]
MAANHDHEKDLDKIILKSPALLKYILEISCYPREHEQLKQLSRNTSSVL